MDEKKINLPTTWEEYCSTVKKREAYFLNNQGGITSSIDDQQLDPKSDRNLIVGSIFTAEAFKALIQLVNIRKSWIQNWDASQAYLFYSIYSDKHGEIKMSHFSDTHTLLSFPTEEMAKEFLNCFGTLIMQARELL